MSLQEQKIIDRVEVLQMGEIQVRQATIIENDGVEVARSYQRWLFAPGQDVSDMPEKVQAIAAATWTPDVVSAYNAAYEARVAERVNKGVQQ